MALSSKARAAAFRLGVDVQRLPPRGSVFHLLRRVLRRYGIDSVVDVGANTGQWAKQVYKLGFGGPVASFEPVHSAFRDLSQAAARRPDWRVENLAVGNELGTVQLHIPSGATNMASILEFDPASVAGWRDNGTQRAERWAPDCSQVATLVTLDSQELPGNRVLLKTDTQGFDRQVLEGASALLDRVVAVQCELSILPIYTGMGNEWRRMIDMLGDCGFEIAGMFPITSDGALRQIEFDGVFVKAKSLVND